MQGGEPTMAYVILRDVRGEARGFVRLESTQELLRVFIRAEVEAADGPLRLLLVSAGDEGAALDLGCPENTAAGAIRWTRAYPAVDLRLWDAVALAEDWPRAQLVAAGWLNDSSASFWRIQEAIEQFLRVPLPQNP